MRNWIFLTVLSIVLFALSFFGRDSRLLASYDPINHPEVIQVERMIENTGATVPATIKKKVAMAIAENARYYNIKPKHLVAIAFVESSFRPNLINETDDYGVMQINWQHWGKKFTKDPNDLLNVYKNVEFACKIINFNKSMGFTKLSAYHSLVNSPDYETKLASVLRRI